MKSLRDRLREQAAINNLDKADPALLRDYYQSVLDSVGSVVYTVDRELRISGVNQQWDRFATIHGAEHLTRRQILGSHLLEQMDGAPLQRWRSVCRRILSGELPRYVDEIAASQSSDWRHYSLAATPLCDSQGDILGITFVATNITQLKKAEHEMFERLVQIRGLQKVAQATGNWAERRQFYKRVTADIANLFGADKCVIFLWDAETGNLQAQEPAYGLAGRKLAELHLDMGHPADSESLWIDLEEKDYILLNEGDEAPADMIEASARVDRLAAVLGVLRISGRVHGAILVAGRDRPFSDQDGQLVALFAVPTALSIENAELHRRLLDHTQQLATTRHDLNRMVKMQQAVRMPLSVVQGYLELLIDGSMGPISEAHLPPLQIVLDKAQAIIDLINRFSPRHVPIDAQRHERISLTAVVNQALDRHRSAIERSGITLVTDLPNAQEEESATEGDPDLLLRVFDTLLHQAIQRCPEGGRLQTSLHRSNDIVYVEIANSGEEIPLDQLLNIWSTEEVAGRSRFVSLPEAKRIVEEHGGQVWAKNRSAGGSAFHVVLRRLDNTRAGQTQ
jgi:PAS domain S-box-containing protein